MGKNRGNPVKLNKPAPFNDINEQAASMSDIPEILQDDLLNLNSSRRNFLKFLGFSFASAAVMAACKRPVITSIPYAIQPPELIPRKPLYYASTFFDGHEYCSIIVKTIDGRPIKLEGNALSQFNGEGTTPRIQASILTLYDDARLKFPESGNKKAEWRVIDEQIASDLSKINAEGGKIVLLTSTINSPTTIDLINSFGSAFRNFKWVQYDAISCSALLEANTLCFGKSVIPDYHFQNASLIVAVNADFLGAWVAPVHFIPKYISQRKLNNGRTEMLRHVHIESGLSLTGSNADQRIRIKPSEEKSLLIDLFNRIASRTGAETIPGTVFREDLSGLADSLYASRGKSIVVSGTNNVDLQIIVNGLNSMLGNYGNTIDLTRNINVAAGIDAEMESLVNDMNEGRVGALLMYNVNPVYDYPGADRLISGLKKTPVTINMSVSLNETVGKAKYECPVNHFLESWIDAEIIPGQLSLGQPCINPIFNTRSFQDSLLKWSGSNVAWQAYLTSSWEKKYFPASGATNFRDFWNKSLANGVFNYPVSSEGSLPFRKDVLSAIKSSVDDQERSGFEIVLTESVAMGTGTQANNPWLMELPDPVSRQCWENVATISPADAANLGITTGSLMRINDLTIPAIVQPGQAEGTVSVALGWGHSNAGPVATERGLNMFPLVRISDGKRIYGYNSATIENTGNETVLALTQIHSSMEGRPIVRETVLSKYRENPLSGNELHEAFEKQHKSLYPDWSYDGFHWAMAIDLNACVGCQTCVIACQAENNTPTVGKDEVTRHRIMHWIRIHRYYSEDQNNPKVYFQPVFCQHCDNAPCENVCPVSATNHSSEGLNQMSYNRCVGTKYCMNNCPYRVRRFNWFRYTNNKEFDFNTVSDLGRMVLNPDVTVRERGVVEKCTFCVQRIQAKKLEAKLENRVLADNEIKTACMQACPAGAIIFGNLNDRDSQVSKIFSEPRRYHLLEELHTLPSIGFLTKVWNDEP